VRSTKRESVVAVAHDAPIRFQLRIVFKGEEGVDGGGLFNDWMSLLTPKLFCPPLFLPVIENDCLTPLLRLNPLPFPFFATADECRQRLRLVGAVLGFSVSRGLPLGVRLSSGFCKVLLGEEPCFDDLKGELPDEYAWMKDVKDTMHRAGAQIGGENAAAAAAAACAAADAKLHVGEDSCGRPLSTPSRKAQVWQSIQLLMQAESGAYDGMMELFQQGCMRSAGRLLDDELASNIACMCGVSDDTILSGFNFDDYVACVVRKQMLVNTQDIVSLIYPAFQAAARQGDGDVSEVTPEYLSFHLGSVSGLELQRTFAGSCQSAFAFPPFFIRAHRQATLNCLRRSSFANGKDSQITAMAGHTFALIFAGFCLSELILPQT
jgi:hypothetical protein